MNIMLVFLRLIHILMGVFWAGTSMFMISIIGPSVRATGETGKKFMQHLTLRSNMSNYMSIAATLTFLSGFFMYWWLSGFAVGWITSPYGLTLTIGSVAGTIGLIYGFFAIGEVTKKMRAVAANIESTGGPPSPEQIAEMQRMGIGMAKAGVISAILLIAAVVGMSIAQYVG